MSITLWSLRSSVPVRLELEQLGESIDEERSSWLDLTIEDLPSLAWYLNLLPGHPLSWEDAATPTQRPKVEDHGDHLFLIMRGLNTNTSAPAQQLETVQLACFLTRHLLISISSANHPSIQDTHRKLELGIPLLQEGVDSVLHAILDHLIDAYRPLVDRWEEDVEILDKEALKNPRMPVLAKILNIRKHLIKLRRLAMGQREVLAQLMREHRDLISSSRRPYFQDVYDHLHNLVDSADGLREVLSMAVDIYLNSVNNRLNEVMKTLTVISAILLPLNLITGFFGMNFEYLPGLKHPHAFSMISLGMLVLSVVMLALFKIFRWI